MAKDKLSDKHFMKLALQLAQRGVYTTSPNPAVGCVIVRDGEVIGKGYHHQAGQPHAEIMAMRNAQEHGYSVEGAVVYVTLEPCSHYGRTPPCAQALCDAYVKKVVVAMTDPNPKVAGRGIAMLRAAGIEVVEGVCHKSAQELNRAFIHSITHKRPWVFVKYGMSLDAKLALSSGESQWITGLESRSDVQRLRLWSDAIITSHVTVKNDNPRLNVRVHELPANINENLEPSLLKQPLRIVIDSHGSLCAKRNKRLLEPYNMFHEGINYLVVGTKDPFPDVQTQIASSTSSGIAATSAISTVSTKSAIKPSAFAKDRQLIVNKDAFTLIKKCRKRSSADTNLAINLDSTVACDTEEAALSVKAKKAAAITKITKATKAIKATALDDTNAKVNSASEREVSASKAAALAAAFAEAEKVTAAEREAALMVEQEADSVFNKDKAKQTVVSTKDATSVLEVISTKRKNKQSQKALKAKTKTKIEPDVMAQDIADEMTPKSNTAQTAKKRATKRVLKTALASDIKALSEANVDDEWMHIDPKAKLVMQGRNYRVEKFAPHAHLVLVPVVKDANGHEHASLEAVLDFLGDMDIRVAMVEAGAQLGSAFMFQQLVNECYCYISPMVLGLGAQDVFALPQATSLQEALHLEITDVTILGHDVRLTFSLPH